MIPKNMEIVGILLSPSAKIVYAFSLLKTHCCQIKYAAIIAD
jgi:hypothetical protein